MSNFTVSNTDISLAPSGDNVQVSFSIPISILKQLPTFPSKTEKVEVELSPIPAADQSEGTGKVSKVKSKKERHALLTDAEVAKLAAKAAKRQESFRKSRESRLAPESASKEEICQRIPRSGPTVGMRCGALKTSEQAICDYCWLRMANLKNSPCVGMTSNLVSQLTEDITRRLFDENPPSKKSGAASASAIAEDMTTDAPDAPADSIEMVVANDD